MANERRAYHLPSVGEPYRGIETVIRVNGLLLNDRRYLDQYKVSEVTGLDDADMVDNREQGTEFDGEYAFNSYYSGRTITIRGEVRAGNFGKLREMQGDLKYATNLLQESPLDFIFNDTEEDFTDTQAVNDYFRAADSAAITNWSIASGKLYTTASIAYLRAGVSTKKYFNFQNLLHFRTGSSIPFNTDIFTMGRAKLNASYTYTMAGWKSSNTVGATTSAQPRFYIGYSDTGAEHGAIASANMTLAVETDYWIKFEGRENMLRSWMYNSDPDEGYVKPLASLEMPLLLDTYYQFATTSQANVGIGSRGMGHPSLGWEIQNASFRSHDTPDVRVFARKVGKVDMPDTQANRHSTRPFMLTLRASNPLLESRVTSFESLPAADNNIVFDDEIILPALFGVANGTVENYGTYYANPVVTFYGPLTNPSLTNTETDETIALEIDLDSSQSATVDVHSRSVYDQAGQNLYGYLRTDHKWMRLSPGVTDVSFVCDTFEAGDPRCEIEFRHGWL
jgi:hypothetical protein